nr:50S ribosomal protein L18P [uncultured archaeon]
MSKFFKRIYKVIKIKMLKTPKKRKKEKKTSYKKRLGFLKSGLSRIVDLLKLGWTKEKKGTLKSIPASYLTGYLMGKKILEKEKGKVILDIGLQRNISKGRIYAVLNGIVDAGVDISHNKKVFPSEERIQGKHLKTNMQKEIIEIKKKLK